MGVSNGMKNIVVVGAGFGGLQAALHLETKFKNNPEIAITLVDRRDYHLFTPNLYEAATAEEEVVSVEQIKESLTLPKSQALKNRRVKFVQGEIREIQTQKKRLDIGG